MRGLAAGLLALACHAALTVYLTWPLAREATTHLPQTAYACRFDSLYSGWTLARQSAALATPAGGRAPGDAFHPASDTIFYGPTATGALIYFAPAFLLTGNPTLALNVTLLLSIALTATALHFVVHRWTGSHLGGLIAGAAYLLTRWTLWEWLPTTPHASVLQYFPLIVLLAAEASAGAAHNLALFALVVLQCLTDLVYVAPAVLAPLALLAIARLLRRETRAAGAILLGIVISSGIVLLIPAAGHFRVRAANPALEQQAYWPIDPEWFREHGTAIPFGLFARTAPTALPAAAFALIALGAFLRRRGRSDGASPGWRSAALWSALGVLMSLTPTVRFGDTAIDLPQAWLADWLPLYGHIRTPSRLGVAALIGLAMLAGLGCAECARRITRAAPIARLLLGALVLAAMLAQYRAHVPPGLRPGPFTPFYRTAPAVAREGPLLERLREPGGPLLELPARLRQRAWAPIWNARAMYRSIFHGRDVLNGYASYWPAGFPERMRLADRLPDRSALAALRARTGLDVVWVHAAELSTAARAEWVALADGGGRDDLRLIAREGDELLFAVAEPAT